MTCKDCIHYEACDISSVYFGGTVGSEKFREYEKRKDIELDCDTFKNKSYFMELSCKGESINKSPCTLCRYNPPSSTDGKPCSICPAS